MGHRSDSRLLIPFPRYFSAAESDVLKAASAADRAVPVELRRLLAVIRGFGSLRYQQADEVQLRKALESRRKVRA